MSYSPRGGKESDTTEHTHTQAYNVLYTRYTHVIGLRVYLHVCLFVSLSQLGCSDSQSRSSLHSKCKNQYSALLPGKQPSNRTVCACAHFAPNALECYQIR